MTVRVVYQGAPGAFGEEAAWRLWPEGTPTGLATFEDVVAAVERGAAEAGVLPVENAIVGPISAALAALEGGAGLDRIGEVTVPVRLHLLALAGVLRSDLTEIVGHPAALAQCRRALGRLGLPVAAWYDSAGAAALLVERNDRTRAVVGGDAVRDRYGLATLESNLEDLPDNATRFVAIRRRR